MQRPALTQISAALLAVVGTLALGGCGGGGSAATPDGSGQIVTTGLPSGLSASLLDNGANAFTVNANGTVAFPSSWTGATYSVTLKSRSPGIVCSVANGSGSFGASPVTVNLSCSTGSLSTIHSFAALGGTDGQSPRGSLVMDASGNLYGTTEDGGANATGMVYELTPSGSGYTETVLYSFGPTTSTDGEHPRGNLVIDSSGNLYGTTEYGGANGTGTVFELTRGGSGYTETILHAFGPSTGTDGDDPMAGLVMDASGNLYGTTVSGGANAKGTVFELARGGSGYTESVLHSFGSGTDGSNPQAGLLLDSSGDLLGTTSGGGTSNDGTVFELTPGGSGYTESVLYSFAAGAVTGRARKAAS